jgi:hypothetical protein
LPPCRFEVTKLSPVRQVYNSPPGPGFSGAAAFDSDGQFAGIALLKPVVVAGPANATPAAQALLAPAESVREFLRANGVTAAAGPADAKAAVLRVICVRK